MHLYIQRLLEDHSKGILRALGHLGTRWAPGHSKHLGTRALEALGRAHGIFATGRAVCAHKNKK